MRNILGPKRDEVTGEWRRLRSEKLNDLYSPNNTRVIKSRRMRSVGCVACMEDRRSAYRVWWGYQIERVHLEDMGVDR
jgi:hypothetical protein